MGRRRKIFTQREYERLSKTHQGRQHIRKTYAFCGFMFAVIFAFGIFFGFSIEYLKILATFSIPLCIVSLLLGIGYVVAYGIAEKEEQQRIKVEEQLRIQQEQRAFREAQIKAQAERDRIEKLKAADIEAVDKMPGHIFEDFVGAILSDFGYTFQTTRRTGGLNRKTKKTGRTKTV